MRKIFIRTQRHGDTESLRQNIILRHKNIREFFFFFSSVKKENSVFLCLCVLNKLVAIHYSLATKSKIRGISIGGTFISRRLSASLSTISRKVSSPTD